MINLTNGREEIDLKKPLLYKEDCIRYFGKKPTVIKKHELPAPSKLVRFSDGKIILVDTITWRQQKVYNLSEHYTPEDIKAIWLAAKAQQKKRNAPKKRKKSPAKKTVKLSVRKLQKP
jgi:hypothetical protein